MSNYYSQHSGYTPNQYSHSANTQSYSNYIPPQYANYVNNNASYNPYQYTNYSNTSAYTNYNPFAYIHPTTDYNPYMHIDPQKIIAKLEKRYEKLEKNGFIPKWDHKDKKDIKHNPKNW